MLGVETYLLGQTSPIHPFACSSTFCFSLDSCCVVRLTGLWRKAVSRQDDVYTRAFLVDFVVRTGANEVGVVDVFKGCSLGDEAALSVNNV